MNHSTGHPPGSPRDILIRLKRTEQDILQLLTDVQSCNDHNPNFAEQPIDVGRYIVQLAKTREVKGQVQRLIEAGATNLPNDIMAPLLEPW